MDNAAKKIAEKILLQNCIASHLDITILEKIILDKGFSIIPYNKYNNTGDTNDLIEKLKIENMIATKDSFVYLSENIRLVFINDDLSIPEKEILLRHELGHICDPNFNLPGHIYSKINREDFANEFSHYLGHPTFNAKMISSFLKYKLYYILSLLLVTISVFWINYEYNDKLSNPIPVTNMIAESEIVESDAIVSDTIESEIYYVTPSGKRYHKKWCKYIKYRNNTTEIYLSDAEKEGYSPCLGCIGN